jgi:hypothetical protein
MILLAYGKPNSRYKNCLNNFCFENLFIKQSLMWNKAMKKLKEEQSEETAVWHSLFIGCKCFTDHVNGRCASWYRHWRSTAPSIWSTI